MELFLSLGDQYVNSIEKLTAVKILHDLKAGLISPVALVDHMLARIESRKHLNAFITTCNQYAMERAKQSFDRIAKGEPRRLEGLPIALKDMYCTKGIRTTAGSKILANFIPPYSGTIVQRLEEAGAIILGKTNQDEFAMGSANEYSAYEHVLNPLDESSVPGGSSGGAAVAIADHLSYISFGTDTGGSNRLPASFCGIVGYKPTYGAFSRFGVIPFASSFDCPSIFAKTVGDVRLIANVVGGKCKSDSTSIQVSFESQKTVFCNLKFAYIKEHLEWALPETKANFEQILKIIKEKGGSVKVLEMPDIAELLKMYYIITPTEAYSNLLKYDGIRYGEYVDKENLDTSYLATRSLFGKEVIKRILLGVDVLFNRRSELDYAISLRAQFNKRFENLYNDIDAIIHPTAIGTAFKRSAIQSETDEYAQDILTVLANIIQAPAISICSGYHEGMPLGLSIMCNKEQDGKMLDIAEHFENYLKEKRI